MPDKLPAWSVFVIVPLIIIGSSFKVIQRSESPVKLSLIVGITSIVVSVMAFFIMKMLDQRKSK